jgi:transaldolase
MSTPLASLVRLGTKVWLDSVDPGEIARNRSWGATGATSNPIIVADLIKTGRFDDRLGQLLRAGLDDEAIAWQLTDQLVRDAQHAFLPVWEATRGDDGYVSFELDPLLEDPAGGLTQSQRVERYVELGKKWSANQPNRLIKVPATPAGLGALEALTAAGVNLNVTLIFVARQYEQARDAIWKGAQRRGRLDGFKSVYSIFVSRLDVYAAKHAPGLSPEAAGQVGILNAKRIWQLNQRFWAERRTPLKQEIVFASTGTKNANEIPWRYVAAFAGSDIETNPPLTNARTQESGLTFARQVDQLPPPAIVSEIDAKINQEHLYTTLMAEGIAKFADPQKALLALIAEKRAG